jgi:hypothetical protein
MSWDSETWKKAARDYHANRPQIAPPNLPENWNQMSIGSLWGRLNSSRWQGAPDVTYEAALHELRARGIAQLAKQNCLRRLGDLSSDQVDDLITALIGLQPKHPSITDEMILKLGDFR